jgi:hypothetical protein
LSNVDFLKDMIEAHIQTIKEPEKVNTVAPPGGAKAYTVYFLTPRDMPF